MKRTEYFWLPVLMGSAGVLFGTTIGTVLDGSIVEWIKWSAAGVLVVAFWQWSKVR